MPASSRTVSSCGDMMSLTQTESIGTSSAITSMTISRSVTIPTGRPCPSTTITEPT